MSRERILNSNLDAGVGFELTEADFRALGEKQADMLAVHDGKGEIKRVPQMEPFEMEEIMEAEKRFISKNFRGH